MKSPLRHHLATTVGGAFLALAAATAGADDIDIYASASSDPTGAPKVMFTLDWRPNLASEVCQGSECDFLVAEGHLEATPTSFFNLLRAVLRRVLLNLDGVEVGLMLAHEQGGGRSCSGPQTGNSTCTNGGYILKGLTSVDDGPGMADFFNRLDALPTPQGNVSHKYQGAEMFFELFRYLTGQGIYNGHNGWLDYGTDDQRNIDDPEDTAPTDGATLIWDTAIENGSNYISPLAETGGCGTRIYTINLMFQVSQQEDDSDTAILAAKDAGGMAGISLRPPFKTSGKFGRVIEYLHDVDLADGTFGGAGDLTGDQNVISYFIVDPSHINNTTNGYAQAGGTGSALALSNDPQELIDTIEDIFNQILSVSTTLVSPSLPLNVFNRVDLVDDVYLAIFRADSESRPFWNGNLKKLKLATDAGGDPILLDANDVAAVNPLDGRIKNTALTLWSVSQDIPAPPDGETDWVQGADGRATNQGGGGGVIPGFRPVAGYSPGLANPVSGTSSESGPRRLFTEPSAPANGASNAFMALNADEDTAQTVLEEDDFLFTTVLPLSDCGEPATCTSYDAASDADEDEAVDRMVDLLAFARGLEDSDGDGDLDDKRVWFIGDPLHSRPQPINYGGSEENPDIRILMASNDGFLHMFGGDDGVEDWAFMPRAVMPVLKRLRDNNAGVQPLHPYTVDGSASTLVIDSNRDGSIVAADNDRAIVFIGLRRGGKHFYAIDATIPDSPTLLWRLGPTSSGFEQMGQSWSRLSPVYLKYDHDGSSATDPVGTWAVIFGGGYNGDDRGDDVPDAGETDLGKDTRNDADPTFAGSDDHEGNAIYIVNAFTGALIWKATGPSYSGEAVTTGPATSTHYRHAQMRDSIAAEVSVTNAVADPFHDRAYVGDTGGVVWRVDFLDPSPANWKVSKLFSAGRHYSTGTTLDDRRFFHAFDIVRAADDVGEFDAIVGASGTRPHPLSALTEDYLYMIKDRQLATAASDSPTTHDDVQDLSNNCLQDGDPSDCAQVSFEDADGDPDTADTPILTLLEKGWKMRLEQCEDLQTTGNCGEKGLSKPTTFLGKVFFTSYIPPGQGGTAATCAPSEGTGLKYIVSLQNATAVRNLNLSNDSEDAVTYDRFERLTSGGIPSNIIRIGTQNDKTVFINPDLTFDFDVDLSYLKTYWYQNLTR